MDAVAALVQQWASTYPHRERALGLRGKRVMLTNMHTAIIYTHRTICVHLHLQGVLGPNLQLLRHIGVQTEDVFSLEQFGDDDFTGDEWAHADRRVFACLSQLQSRNAAEDSNETQYVVWVSYRRRGAAEEQNLLLFGYY